MQVSRKAVTAALFAQLKDAYNGFQTADPRLSVPDDISATMQPALFLARTGETQDQPDTPGLNRYRLHYMALICVRASSTPEDPDATAEVLMDTILDAIDAALQAPKFPPGERNTLGGLVYNCTIDGQIQIDSPVLFEQCAIWIPITVETGI